MQRPSPFFPASPPPHLADIEARVPMTLDPQEIAPLMRTPVAASTTTGLESGTGSPALDRRNPLRPPPGAAMTPSLDPRAPTPPPPLSLGDAHGDEEAPRPRGIFAPPGVGSSVPSIGDAVTLFVYIAGFAALVSTCPKAVVAVVLRDIGLPEDAPHVGKHEPKEAAELGAAALAIYAVGYLVLWMLLRGHTALQNAWRLAVSAAYATWSPFLLTAHDQQLLVVSNVCVLLVTFWDVLVAIQCVAGVRPWLQRHGLASCPFCKKADLLEIDLPTHLHHCARTYEVLKVSPPWARPTVDENDRGAWERYTFSWVSDLVRFASAMPGYLADRRHMFAIPPLPASERAASLGEPTWEKFVAWRRSRAGEREREAADSGVPLIAAPATLTGAAAASFFFLRTASGRRFVYVIPLKVLQDALVVLTAPLITGRLIRYLRNDDDVGTAEGAMAGAYVLASACVALTLQAFVFQAYQYHLAQVALAASCACRAALHAAVTAAPMYARSGFGHGDIIAMATVDSQRIADSVLQLHNLWGYPLMIVACFFVLEHYVGWFSAVSAFGALVGLAYINRGAMASATFQQRESARATAQRSADTSDVLQCIRAIKFIGWEATVARSLNDARDMEAAAEARSVVMRAVTTLVTEFGTALAYLVCFVAYYMVGGEFDAAKLVPAVASLNALRFPIWSFPTTMQTVLRGSTSASRVASFLSNVAESLNHRRVRVEPPTPSEPLSSVARTSYTVVPRSATRAETEGPTSPFGQTHHSQSHHSITGVSPPTPTTHGSMVGRSAGSAAPFGHFAHTPTSSPLLAGAPDPSVGGSHGLFRLPANGSVGSIDEQHARPQSRQRRTTLAPRAAHVYAEPETTVAPHPAAAFQLQCSVDGKPFDVTPGELVFLSGPSASGKSTFLRALAGEACITSGDLVVTNATRVAYLPQTPWIFSGTVRANILSGAPLDRARYQRVLAATALQDDVATWDEGDLHDVGNAGAALSGGQRARVALARACYSDASVYLIDDVLSGLDEPLQLHIVRRCLLGLLRNRTRIYTSFGDPASSSIPAAYAELGRASNLSLLVNPNGRGFTTNARASTQLRAFASAAFDGGSRSTSPGTSRSNTPSTPSLGKRPRRPRPPTLTNPATVEALRECQIAFGKTMLVIVLVVAVAAQACLTLMDAAVGAWSTERMPHALPVLRALAILGPLGALFSAIRAYAFHRHALTAATKVHKDVVGRVVHSSLAWVEAPTRIGAITAVLTKDQDTIDHAIPDSAETLGKSAIKLSAVGAFNGVIRPSLLVLIPVTFVSFYQLTIRYLAAARDVRRLGSVVRNDSVQALANALRGGPVARGLGTSDKLRDEHDAALDEMNATTNAGNVLARWVGLRLEFVAFLVTFFVMGLAMASKGHVHPAFAGIAVANCLTTTRTMLTLCRALGVFQSQMASVEQIVSLHKSIPPPVVPKELPPPLAATPLTPIARSNDPLVAVPSVAFSPSSIGGSSLPGHSFPNCQLGAPAARLTHSASQLMNGPSHQQSSQSPNGPCALVFSHVAVRYPGQSYDTVTDVTFRVGEGEYVVLVGRTGAGKSTLVSALLGHATVTHGWVTVLGKCVADGSRARPLMGGGGLPESLRHLVGVVPQDPMLMPRLSWRQHLVAAGTYVPDGVLRRALQTVGLARLVSRTLDDTLEASGVSLSPSQAQMLSFARVLCMQQVKLVILDEPSATVDSNTEAAMVHAIRGMPNRPAVLCIAHGGRVLEEADRVVDLTLACDLETPIGSLMDARGCSSSLFA